MVVGIKQSVIYYKSVYYAMLLVIFAILGYIFFDSGFNTRTKVRVDYEDKSDVYYEIGYINDSYQSTGDRYVSNMVDNITFKYDYENIISEYVGGYYRYSVNAYLITFEDEINNSLWEREYHITKEKTEVIDKNNINSIKITDGFTIDFDKYRDEVYKFIDDYSINLSGYLQVRINILESLNFSNLNNEYVDTKKIVINIPLTEDTFKIDVTNIDSKNSCYELTSDRAMNFIFLIIGTFCFSVSFALLILVIRQFVVIYNKQNDYHKKLKKILSKYEDSIVRVKRFYVKKKYNLIYLDEFDDLIDVSKKKNRLINFKEIKKDNEAIFVIIDEDDAWIYKLY